MPKQGGPHLAIVGPVDADHRHIQLLERVLVVHARLQAARAQNLGSH